MNSRTAKEMDRIRSGFPSTCRSNVHVDEARVIAAFFPAATITGFLPVACVAASEMASER